MIADLMRERDALAAVVERADGMHDDPAAQAQLLTTEGADAIARVRAACDTLELSVPDALWPLPKYREMLFPV